MNYFTYPSLLLRLQEKAQILKSYLINLWLHWVFVAVHRLSLVAVSGDYSGCGECASHSGGFSCCRAQPLDTQAQQLQHAGLAVQGTLIFLVQGLNLRTLTGSQILTHCTTREVLQFLQISTVPRTSPCTLQVEKTSLADVDVLREIVGLHVGEVKMSLSSSIQVTLGVNNQLQTAQTVEYLDVSLHRSLIFDPRTRTMFLFLSPSKLPAVIFSQ